MLWLCIFYLHAFQNKPPLLRNKRHSTVGSCFFDNRTENSLKYPFCSTVFYKPAILFLFFWGSNLTLYYFRKMTVVFPFLRTNYADHCVCVCSTAWLLHSFISLAVFTTSPPPSSSFPFSTGTLSPTVFIPAGLY